jgi:hypothetical protein
MADMEKYKRGQMGHMFQHYERALDKEGKHIKYGNRDIDTTRSHLNYNLAPDRGMTQFQYMQKRLKEVICMKRPDIITACTWLITAPGDLPENQRELFFQTAYTFLELKYGKENVISAYVHRDENQKKGHDHLHFCHVPVIDGERKGKPVKKVCAKELYSLQHLNNWHKEFQRAINDAGIACNVNTGITKEQGGNKTIKQLKQQPETIDEIIEEATKETQLAKLEKENKKLKKFMISYAYGNKTMLQIYNDENKIKSDISISYR